MFPTRGAQGPVGLSPLPTPYLFPPSVDEWLPENHLARFAVEVIEQLDLTPLTRQYGHYVGRSRHGRRLRMKRKTIGKRFTAKLMAY